MLAAAVLLLLAPAARAGDVILLGSALQFNGGRGTRLQTTAFCQTLALYAELGCVKNETPSHAAQVHRRRGAALVH